MQRDMFMLRKISFVDAFREGIEQSLKKDKNLFLMGEGINDPSPMWGTVKGIKKNFGEHRTVEMPVAENGLIGTAIGAALNGSKVVINLQRIEFALYAYEQIINNAAKSHYISRGKHTVPIVLRAVIGRGWGQGPEHGQSLENIFAAIPGLKVVIPTFPSDAKNLLINSIFDPNPVIFIEHRWSHYSSGLVDKKFKINKLKNIEKVTNGKDLTIIANSVNLIEARRISNIMKKHNISIEILNLQMISPLDIKEIYKSVRKTNNLLTIDLGHKFLNIGGEIIAQLLERGIKFRRPPIRLGLPFHPVPSSRGYIQGFYPDGMQILKSIKKILNINNQKFTKILKEFNQEKSKLPIDVPDPYFKGPF